jgi:hypothetical protein
VVILNIADRKKKKGEGRIRFNVSMTPKILERLRVRSDDTGIPMSVLVRKALDSYLNIT